MNWNTEKLSSRRIEKAKKIRGRSMKTLKDISNHKYSYMVIKIEK